MDESQRDLLGDAAQAGPPPIDPTAAGRLVRARRIAEIELGIAAALILAVVLTIILKPTFMGGDAPSVWDDLGPGIGIVVALVALLWMIRIYRRSFVAQEDPPPWRSRRPR